MCLLSSCRRTNSTWILSVTDGILKLLEGKPEKAIQDRGIDQDSKKTLVTQKIKPHVDNWTWMMSKASTQQENK